MVNEKNDYQIHRTISNDGTEIAGVVHGQGPHLVFIHGAMDDGTLQWKPAIPFLSDRFTCHVISVRNRGHSGHSMDMSPPRFVEDVVGYASSLSDPVGLVGLSVGGTWALAAASRLPDIKGVVACEPVVNEVINVEISNRLGSVVMREAEEAREGRLASAVRIFAEFVGNDEEIAALDAAGAFEAMGSNVPADLAGIKQSMDHHGPSLTDASILAQIKAPVLLLQGGSTSDNSRSWFHAGIQYVAEKVPQVTVHKFVDLGHLAPMVAPEPVAGEIARFFSRS